MQIFLNPYLQFNILLVLLNQVVGCDWLYLETLFFYELVLSVIDRSHKNIILNACIVTLVGAKFEKAGIVLEW